MEIFLIAAVDKNLAIGKNGKIPWHIKEDLRHFKKNTLRWTGYFRLQKIVPFRQERLA